MAPMAVPLTNKDEAELKRVAKLRGTTPKKLLVAAVRDLLANAQRDPDDQAAFFRSTFAGRKNMGDTVAELREMREGA